MIQPFTTTFSDFDYTVGQFHEPAKDIHSNCNIIGQTVPGLAQNAGFQKEIYLKMSE